MTEPYTNQCPQRGPGLRHTVSTRTHGVRCVDCGMILSFDPADTNQKDVAAWLAAEMNPPLDVMQRMKDLGMIPVRDSETTDTDELPLLRDIENGIEGRHVTGEGPDGDKIARGRSEMFDARGRAFGQHHKRMLGLMLYWRTRLDEDH